MSSKKDLVEAHAFNRRRLITAFVSGAPGGREVEPVRYGRTLVGGLVLAALVVVGAAVSPLLKPALPKNWNENGLVVGKDSGSRFVAFRGTLYPVINTTSARLILGADGKFDVNFVPDDKIAEQKQGPIIGIPGAPDLLPTPGNLIESGWSACTNESGGIRVVISEKSGARATATDAFVVKSEDGRTSVISGQNQYPVPSDATGNATLLALGLGGEPAKPVPGLWLDLVPPGEPLQPFRVDGAGDRADTGAPKLTTIGAPVQVDDRPYVLSEDGLLPVTDFAYTVYRSSGPGAQIPEVKLRSGEVGNVRIVNAEKRRPYPADWPADDVQAYPNGDAPCLLLTTVEGGAATVRLAVADPDSTTAAAPASGVTRGVDSGHGALVEATSGGVIGSGSTFLVDGTGTRYAIGQKGSVATALASLGYDGVQPRAVPARWMDLFADGPTLSAAAVTATAGGAR